MKNCKDKLRMLIEDYWRRELPDFVERDIKIDTDTPLIVDVVGPRRAGKTSLMLLTIKNLIDSGVDKKHTIYVNFERRVLYPLDPECFNHLVEIIYEEELMDEKLYLFLDEVQRVSDWERFVRSMYDEFKGKMKIVISGSTNRLTKSTSGYLLTGRHRTTPVFPLSFREFLRFRGFEIPKYLTEEDRAKVKRYLREYIQYGGFPEVVLSSTKEEYLETLFLDIITRDVSTKVKYPELMEDIAYFLVSQSSKLVSFSKLSKLLISRGIKISVPTLERYFSLMKDAFLFFDSRIYSFKIKDQLQYPRKIYCVDTGFVNYFGFKFSEDQGRLMENLVAVELHRRAQKGMKIHYWKDAQGKEVDFVIREGARVKELIQVTHASGKDEIKKREISALEKAGEELGCKNKTIITWDYEEQGEINFVPLWKWLLKVYR